MASKRKTLLVLIGALALMVECVAGLDSAIRNYYARNKLAFIAALIEDYRAKYGAPPDTLTAIVPSARAYLSAHPDFSQRYLEAKWSKSEIPLLKGPCYDNDIRYMRVGPGYYLYLSTLKVNTQEFSEARLDQIIQGCCPDAFASFWIIHDGRFVYGHYQNDEVLTLSNMERHMQAYRGREILRSSK